MTWTQERSAVNQRVQLGVEASGAHGTAVAANRLLLPFSWDFGIEVDQMIYGATGRKYEQVAEENEEWSGGTLSGPLDFNALIYPFGSIFGAITPVTHGVSTIAKDWVYTPPVAGSIEPNTFTCQQGDGVTEAEQYTYVLVTKFGYKLTRKDVTFSGTLIGQALTTGITMTSSPTTVALAPISSAMFNVYLDTGSASLGNTQLLRPLSVDYAFDGVYQPLWVLNRTTITWSQHVDMKPKSSVKLMLEADTTGVGLLVPLQQGQTRFMRVQAQGSVIDNLQTVTLGTQTSGTWTLTYKGQTTASINYNDTAATVQTRLIALSTIGTGNVTVSGSAGGPYSVIFGGTLAQDTTAMTGTFTGLSTPGNASITQNQSYNVLTHDMAIKIGKPSPFKDDSGVFAVEWDCTIV
jgi:hypothetical protein